jgi:hypothetical protein
MTAPIIENTYTGDGSTVLFSFTFEYIEATDIEVSIDAVTVATTAYALANSTTIEFTTAPASGAAIRIYRNTTVDSPKATFFPGSAIRAQDLNDNFEQILFVTQEADAISERAETAADAAQIATTAAQTAAASATSAANTAQAAVTSAQTSATQAAADAASAAADASQAATDAATAVSTANTASATATQASTDASSAVSTANAASTTANTASTNASNAVTTANSASANASTALSTSNTAATDASTALSTANTASTNASNAVTTANAASAAVQAAYLFVEIANVAAIPSNPSNNDAVRVVDSTSIQTTSTVQGVPTGFVGDSGIFVDILYSSSAQKWNFVNYNANDPDDRYGYPPYVDITRQNTVDAATLSGLPLNSTHLGAFTGSTISDSISVKAALQELETELETKVDSVNGQTGAVTLTASSLSALPISGGTLTGDVTFNPAEELRFFEAPPALGGSGTQNYIAIAGPTVLDQSGGTDVNYTLTLPTGMPDVAGKAIISDLNGNLSWGFAGGASGGGNDQWAVEHDNTITTSYTIGTGKNVISAGPLTVNSGAVVTVPSGSTWTIV